MTVSQKRAIGYTIRERERKNQEYFLVWKNLLDDFKSSRYKSMLWYIKSKGLNREYNQACYYYGNRLENLPRKGGF